MLDVFHRTALAHDMALRLIDPPATSAVRSGLFLAAPRRTGKSTFLREDLIPALETAGAVVLYVDLWAQRPGDPGDVIVAAVGAALAREQGAVPRLLERLGDASLSVGSVSISLGRADEQRIDVSTTDALAALSEATGRVIVLVIDEAQHAITTTAGSNALFGLKAARDELNSRKHHGLRIVATGSNSDKLAMLRNSKQQAFFGAPLIAFPPLDKDYVRWFVDRQSFADALDVDQVMRWFARAGHRPEVLGAAADAIAFATGIEQGTVASRLETAIDREIAIMDEETLSVVRSLSALQSAVLCELAVQGRRYAPFEHATLRRYAVRLRAIAPESTLVPSTANVQRALGVVSQIIPHGGVRVIPRQDGAVFPVSCRRADCPGMRWAARTHRPASAWPTSFQHR